MGKFIDLTDQKFGRWTALEYVGKSKWKCQCECGTIKEVDGYNLVKGISKSCGCYRTDIRPSFRSVDYSGQKFGRLNVLEKIYVFKQKAKYKCQCDCGNVVYILANNFVSNGTKSCGCYRDEKIHIVNSGDKSYNWKGGVTAKNIALYDTHVNQLEPIEKAVPFEKDGMVLLKVECKKCGILFIPTRSQVDRRISSIKGTGKGGNNFYCSSECRENCSIFKQHKYPKGYKPESNRPYVDQLWREMVLERDDFICQICGSEDNLIAHHIFPAAEYPMLANDFDNGICLCKSCHYKKAHVDDRCKPANINKCKG